MNEYFKIGKRKTAPAKPANDAYANGHSWRVVKHEDRYTLEFLSGELSGKEKKHDIQADDALALKNGKASIDAILIKYGVS